MQDAGVKQVEVGPAVPNPLIRLTHVFCPSTWPELQELDRPAMTAAWSWRRPLTREWRAGRSSCSTRSIHAGELVAAQVAHHRCEVADVSGRRIEFGTTGTDLFEGQGVLVREVVGVRHDPSGDRRR